VGHALCAMGNICSTEIARDLAHEVEEVVGNQIRRKSNDDTLVPFENCFEHHGAISSPVVFTEGYSTSGSADANYSSVYA
jgi:hypothetical protein